MEKFYILVEVLTPVGRVVGRASIIYDTSEEAIKERDKIQSSLVSLDMFTLFNDANEEEITLTEYVIKHSIFIFSIERFER